MSNNVNPFVVSGKIPEAYFCKTLLMDFVFDKKTIKDEYITISVDILQTTTFREFIFTLGTAVFDAMKKTLLLLFFVMLSVVARAEDVVCIDGVSYRLNAETMEATAFTADENFARNRDVEEIVILEHIEHNGQSYTVTAIGEDTFGWRYSKLRHVTLPSTIRTIGEYAFIDAGLEELVIPDNVDSIANGAFSRCEKLKSLNLGRNLRYLGEYAFKGCLSLSGTISFSPRLEHIGYYAFGGDYRDMSWTPGSYRVHNTDIQDYEVDPENPFFCSIDGVVYSKDGSRLVIYPSGRTTFRLPSSVSVIGKHAFSMCAVEEVVIPTTVKKLEACAFTECGLKQINFDADIDTIPDDCFRACDYLKKVVLPSNCKYIGLGSFEQCGINEIELPNSVEKVDMSAFSQSQLRKIHIGSGTKYLEISLSSDGYRFWGYNSFSYCKELEEIVVDEANPWYSSYKGALYDKSQTTLFVMPGGQKDIVSDIFSPTAIYAENKSFHSPTIESIDIPSTMKYLHYATLSCCSSLHDLYLHTFEPYEEMKWPAFWYEIPSECVIHVPQGRAEAYATYIKESGREFQIVDDQAPASVVEGEVNWGYVNGWEVKGNQNCPSITAGVLIKKEQLSMYKGCEITGLQFNGTSTSSSPVTAFIAKEVGGEKIVTAQLHTPAFLYSWRQVTFHEPYMITGDEDLFIGVELPRNEDYNFWSSISFTGIPVPDGVQWYDNSGTGENWQELNYKTEEGGGYAMSITIHGQDIPVNLFFIDEFYTQLTEDGHHLLKGQLGGVSSGHITSYEFSYRIDNGEIQNYSTETELVPNLVYDFSMPIDVETGQHVIELWAKSLNGKSDMIDNDSHVMQIVTCTDKVYDRKVVVEELTATWCPYSPRGIIGIRGIMEEYPGHVIPIAVHDDEEMGIDDYSYFRKRFSSIPSCTMDRKEIFDPSLLSLENYMAQHITRGIACIEMEGLWADEDHSQMMIKSVCQFPGKMIEEFRVAHLVVENKVGPYEQANIFSGGWFESSPEFEMLPPYAPILHDHVVRSISSVDGIPGSLPTELSGQKDYTHTYLLTLPDNIQNLDNVEVIVLLLNANTGEVVNANSMPVNQVKPYEPNSIISTTSDKDTNEIWFSVDGQRLYGKPQGKGIFVSNGKKVVISRTISR